MTTSNINTKLQNLRKNQGLLKFVVNRFFNFGELSPKYSDVDSSAGNIYCPFHPSEGYGENQHSPSGKIYYDEERDIPVIHCFTSHRTYTCFDFITRVLEQEPFDYLIKNKDISEIREVYEAIEKGYLEYAKSAMDKKISYVNNVFEETKCDVADYIEVLYTNNEC